MSCQVSLSALQRAGAYPTPAVPAEIAAAKNRINESVIVSEVPSNFLISNFQTCMPRVFPFFQHKAK